MKNNLKEYKKNLELDRKLKAECRTLQETIYSILKQTNIGVPPFRVKKEKNMADNRGPDIVTSDEEQDS